MADEHLPASRDIYELGSGRASVRSVVVKNFRSIRAAEIDFSELTILVGANGAGKSNVVDVFRFISDSLSLGLHAALERRGGLQAVRHRSAKGRPRNVRIGINIAFQNGFSAEYEFQISAQREGSYVVAEEICRLLTPECVVFGEMHIECGKIMAPIQLLTHEDGRTLDYGQLVLRPPKSDVQFDPTLLALPLVATIPGYSAVHAFLRDLRSYSIVPDRLREPQDPDEGQSMHPDGRNATSVLRHLEPDDRRELIDMLGHAVPGIEDVKTMNHGNKLTLEFTQRTPSGRNRFEAHQMSDGTLRLLGILLALYQPKLSKFVAVEEPESTVHVAALEAMIEVFKMRSADVQLLLTTHSSDILDFVDIDDVRLVRAESGHSTVTGVAEHSKNAVREALFSPGELFRSDALRSTNDDITIGT